MFPPLYRLRTAPLLLKFIYGVPAADKQNRQLAAAHSSPLAIMPHSSRTGFPTKGGSTASSPESSLPVFLLPASAIQRLGGTHFYYNTFSPCSHSWQGVPTKQPRFPRRPPKNFIISDGAQANIKNYLRSFAVGRCVAFIVLCDGA